MNNWGKELEINEGIWKAERALKVGRILKKWAIHFGSRGCKERCDQIWCEGKDKNCQRERTRDYEQKNRRYLIENSKSWRGE